MIYEAKALDGTTYHVQGDMLESGIMGAYILIRHLCRGQLTPAKELSIHPGGWFPKAAYTFKELAKQKLSDLPHG